MIAEIEIQIFQNLMTRRFKGIAIHWENASNNYHILDDFLIHLNSTIQEMRNITFLLQNYKKLYIDFDNWYAKKQEAMKADENLKWLHDARTKVVHQKELEVSSIAKVTLLNWEQLNLPELELSPLLQDQEIIFLFSEFIQTKFFINLAHTQGKPLVKVKRIWIDNEFGKSELLELLQYGHDFLYKLIFEFFGILGVDGFIIEGLNLTELNNKQEFLFDISTGSYLKPHKHSVRFDKIPDKIHLEAKEVIDAIKKLDTGDNIGDVMKYHLDFNKIALLKQSELMPICIFLNKNLDIVNVRFIQFTNRAEKYGVVMELAKEIRENIDITAVLFIGEVWLVDVKNYATHYNNPSKETATGEAISGTFLNKEGQVRNMIIPVQRKGGEVEFGTLNDDSWLIKENPERSGILSPIAKIWGLL